MGLEIIGAGFGRTGTLSLKFALEELGFNKCYHMMEIPKVPHHISSWRKAAAGKNVDWHLLFQGYKAAVDWPSCNYWREQLRAFPEAKIILTKRDADDWYESVINTIWPASVKGRELARSNENLDKVAQDRSSMVFEVIWDGIFDDRMSEKDFVIDKYEKHNQSVIDEVPSSKLLVYEPGEGWEPLCQFLGCSQPSIDYPNVNSTEEFSSRMKSS